MQNLTFKFCRPCGSERQQPSLAMIDALRLLSETTEMQPLLAQATKSGRTIAIEVFQSRDGQPLLIHIKKEAA
jgi:alpha-D-ribose 1-methylphosphonate 5-triphosphate synthase subunit PhnH